MLSEEINKALNKQLNQELRNAYLYLSMAAYLASRNLNGFSHYFTVQAKEEIGHAMRIYKYILDRGGRVVLEDIPKPKTEWKDLLELARDFYEAEVSNTKRIWELVELARKHGDKATESFLKWFIDEQVEEESQASQVLALVKMVRDSPPGILALDQRLGQRKE
ncbi:MAG: ferritin [Thermoprotei archaeon]